MSLINTIIWMVALWFLVWPCAAFGSFVYVFAAPFEACVPQCAPLLEFCMKLIVWPKAAGKGIVAGTDFTCC